MRTMGYLGLLLSAGTLFGFVLTYYRVPQEFTELFLSFELSPYTVLTIVVVFYILLGMFLEPVSMTFITLPTIFPLMAAAGFDLILVRGRLHGDDGNRGADTAGGSEPLCHTGDQSRQGQHRSGHPRLPAVHRGARGADLPARRLSATGALGCPSR